jgi:hypothetical protein
LPFRCRCRTGRKNGARRLAPGRGWRPPCRPRRKAAATYLAENPSRWRFDGAMPRWALLAGRYTTSCGDGPLSGRTGNSKWPPENGASPPWRCEARETSRINRTVAPAGDPAMPPRTAGSAVGRKRCIKYLGTVKAINWCLSSRWPCIELASTILRRSGIDGDRQYAF